jgi:hypothetical protein
MDIQICYCAMGEREHEHSALFSVVPNKSKKLMQAARPKPTSKITKQLPHVLVWVCKEGLQKLVQLVKKTPEQNK